MAVAQIQIRRGTTAEWAAASPVVLAAGEPAYDTTLKKYKIGDGTSEWDELPFVSVADDVIWNTAGDLVFGTGANAADILPVGTSGQILTVNSGATKPEWGTLWERDGDYLIADTLGVTRYDNSVDALANVATDGNAAILQPYLTAGESIRFLNGFYAFEDALIIGASRKLAGHDRNGCRLLFPGSKGLVYGTAEYDAYNDVTGLSITANGHCIDFINDGVTFPHNVYWSRFNNLVLNSATGHCVYAGNNLGKSGDIMVFSTHFSDIIVTAPAGAGFYGLDGLDITFERISDAIDIINVFQNCSGMFRDINTSFALAERFLYIDSNNRENYSMHISLENVNIETVTKQAISVVSSTVSVSHLSMKNVKFELPYGTTNSTEYPFYFTYLYAVSIYGLALPGWPAHYNTGTVKAPFRVFVDTYPVSFSGDDYQYYCDMLTSVLRFSPQYFVAVPASGSASGNPGQYSADANYIYVCYAQDTWVRCAKTAW